MIKVGDLVRYRMLPVGGAAGDAGEELGFRFKNSKATVTECDDDDAVIEMQEGQRSGKKFLVPKSDLTIVEEKEADHVVPRASDRRGANMGKMSKILQPLLPKKDEFSNVFKKFKDANLNDNHLSSLAHVSNQKRLEALLGTTNLAQKFRLAVVDAKDAGNVTAPTEGTDAEYAAAAAWVIRQEKVYGAAKKAQDDWLSYRHVHLETNRLRRAIEKARKAENSEEETETPHKGGRKQTISDLLFLKYVVPTMQRGGPLVYDLDDWTAVMRAVYLLSQGLGDDDIVKAVWKGELVVVGMENHIWPKDPETASQYLSRFSISTRKGEQMATHRLAVDPAAVEDVFETLKNRLNLYNITKPQNMLVTDELRFKKEWERIQKALLAVCDSAETRSVVQGLNKMMDGCTMTPVSDVLGNVHVVQVICEDKQGRVEAEVVKKIMADAGFECRIVVSYSATGYQTLETNKHLKEELILALGALHEGWQAGQPLPEAYILIEDGASMHAQDQDFTLTCLTTHLITHHVAPNSTHFSNLFDRHTFRVTKMLAVKELVIRIQAMHSKRPGSKK
jgi:hypothetical protein